MLIDSAILAFILRSLLTKMAFIIIIPIDRFYRGFSWLSAYDGHNKEERAMERLLNAQLNQWRQNPKRKPLVLKGVRQCGKTWLLKEFGEQNYPDVAVFNFEENPSLSSIFEQDLDVKRILLEPKNALIRQYSKLLEMDKVKLEFEDEAIDYVVDKAVELKMGARGLRNIVERIMTDAMFEIPSDSKRKLTISRKYAEEKYNQ